MLRRNVRRDPSEQIAVAIITLRCGIRFPVVIQQGISPRSGHAKRTRYFVGFRAALRWRGRSACRMSLPKVCVRCVTRDAKALQKPRNIRHFFDVRRRGQLTLSERGPYALCTIYRDLCRGRTGVHSGTLTDLRVCGRSSGSARSTPSVIQWLSIESASGAQLRNAGHDDAR